MAARTYALKNMGQFGKFGYDLVNTPRSQLYVGMSAEHPLSNRAVEETRGEVIRYRGELINALYTSTCGGQTEDAENVFAGRPVPYLKSVECASEKQREWRIEAKSPVAPITVDGRNASLDIALLVGLGIVPMGAEPLDFHKDASFDEAVEWIRDTRRLVGVKDQGFVPDSAALDFVSLARLLVEAFGWKDRIEELLLPGEVDFILKDLPQVQGKDRRPLAYCFQSGLFPASVRTGDPLRPVSRAELAMALARVVKDHRDFFKTGTFRAAGKGTIEVGQDFERKTLALSNHVRLLRTIEGETDFATQADPPRRRECPLARAGRPGRLPRGLLPAELQRPRPVLAVQPLAGPQDAAGARGPHQPVLPDRRPRRHRRQVARRFGPGHRARR